MAVGILDIEVLEIRMKSPDQAAAYCGYRKRGAVKRFIFECPCPVITVDGGDTYDKQDLDKWNDEKKKGKENGKSVRERLLAQNQPARIQNLHV